MRRNCPCFSNPEITDNDNFCALYERLCKYYNKHFMLINEITDDYDEKVVDAIRKVVIFYVEKMNKNDVKQKLFEIMVRLSQMLYDVEAYGSNKSILFMKRLMYYNICFEIWFNKYYNEIDLYSTKENITIQRNNDIKKFYNDAFEQLSGEMKNAFFIYNKFYRTIIDIDSRDFDRKMVFMIIEKISEMKTTDAEMENYTRNIIYHYNSACKCNRCIFTIE